MKKILLLVAVVSALSVTSCKKDYTCTCTYTSGSYNYTSVYTVHNTKKKATDACTALATSGETCSIN